MRLSTIQPQTQDKLTRTFQYVHKDDPSVAFVVTTHYLSPALFEQAAEQQTVKRVDRGRVKNSNIDQKELRLAIAKELLLPAIEKIEGFKIRHLKAMVPLRPSEVARLGKLDDTFPATRDVLPAGTEEKIMAGEAKRDEALAEAKKVFEDNVVWLLTNSTDFNDFVLEVTTNLSLYQDEDWMKDIENLSDGRGTSSV